LGEGKLKLRAAGREVLEGQVCPCGGWTASRSGAVGDGGGEEEAMDDSGGGFTGSMTEPTKPVATEGGGDGFLASGGEEVSCRGT
jgi:hypothetical protein